MSFISKSLRYNIIGVEVGVKFGENALDILKNMPNVTLLYLIDPYEKYEGWDAPYKNEIENIAEVAKINLLPFRNRVKWIYKKFEDSIEDIVHTPDFVYIDGNHNYEYVSCNIELATKIVRKGGVIGGHDYDKNMFEVKRAVDEYSSKNAKTLHLKRRDWWFVN